MSSALASASDGILTINNKDFGKLEGPEISGLEDPGFLFFLWPGALVEFAA
jgi:hypothetical protein